ncbi:glucosidase [Amnibacterium sp. CER49]|uniref:MGH1-like glycoside hydrolase domain-containing protein n=1 Tax=Amnibacterium sp. CER49 TaxID=3039161 RepID=UPI00244C69F0|nr:glucosidase [Amnibacterium sp. CER49]MDH2445137.1 glucosidase [Amnibacterium sp. CER49]
MTVGAEQGRVQGDDASAWRRWGPYLSERAWGTVREDYSADGDAWRYFPHDHARSRTYRWNEDGLAGLSDDGQRLCFALAFWNGVDPILKERAFGLTGPEGNHGEDVKEYWWFVDSTPTHSWMRWRYAYPQRAFPYEDLVRENARRTRHDPEYELLDTGVFAEDRYFDVTVDYAKASPDDICIRITVVNRGPEDAVLHVLPTLWFRDTWTWRPGTPVPTITATAAGALAATHPDLGSVVLAGDGTAEPLFCDNATNTGRLWGIPGSAYPKDGINDHVVDGAATVNSARTGTKAALHHVLAVPAGGSHEVRLRLSAAVAPDLAADWEGTMSARAAEADDFYAELTQGATADEAHLVRSAMAGMLWSKQYYAYDVHTWLAGDPGQPPPPAERRQGRNRRWQHLDAEAVVSMPDPWEYPWFAAWDLAFHCVTLAHVDPAFAKQQLAMVLGAGWMHPTGQVPAYEWDFGAVNPPVHAWAALHVFRTDGGTDLPWLRQVFERLIVNSTWWVARNDPEGDGTFSGGFLGMDNIGPFDRGAALPDGLVLEQADATGWMALSCASMLEIALVLSESDPALEDMALMFFDLFTLIADAAETSGLWSEDDGFFYDRITRPDGSGWPIEVRSMSGVVPIFATVTLREDLLARLPRLRARVTRFRAERGGDAGGGDHEAASGSGAALLALVEPGRLRRILRIVGSPGEMLAPHGVRALSAAYRNAPYVLHAGAENDTEIDYEPAESTNALFGGNSNWRGPVWLPVNFLLQQALRRYGRASGAQETVEYPTGSGEHATYSAIADDLSDRLTRLYLPDGHGRRPVWGGQERFASDASWRDALLFYEYFNGDDGAGLGASHQTGWTGLLANLVLERVRDRRSISP